MKVAILSMLVLALTACSASQPVKKEPNVNVEIVSQKMSFSVKGRALSTQDKQAVKSFIVRQGNPNRLRVRIEANTKKGERVAQQLVGLFHQQAVYPSQVEVKKNVSNGGSSKDIVLTIEQFRSQLNSCKGGSYFALGSNRHDSANFGCASSNALAQMVADPRELVVSERLDPSLGRKAVSTLDAYYNTRTTIGLNISDGSDQSSGNKQ